MPPPPGSSWHIPIPCRRQSPWIPQRQQAQEAGTTWPGSDFMLSPAFLIQLSFLNAVSLGFLTFPLLASGHGRAFLRGPSATLLSSAGPGEPWFLLPDGPASAGEGAPPPHVYRHTALHLQVGCANEGISRAEAMFELTRDWVRDRKAFGGRLGDLQTVGAPAPSHY